MPKLISKEPANENVYVYEGLTVPTGHFDALKATFVYTGRVRLIRSHSSARFCFELSGNSNYNKKQTIKINNKCK